MKRTSPLFWIMALMAPMMLLWNDAMAIPAFARKYHTACSTCHIAFPARNGFGEAFRNNGYRFPDNTDEEMVKEEPIKLGSDSYKKVFPDAIWPSDLPNMPTLGFLAKVGAFSEKESGKYRNSQFDQELDVFFAGTITNQISYIGDFALTENDATKLGRLQLLWTFKPGVTMVVGTVGFPEQFDMISMRGGGDRNGFAAQMPNPNKGAELRLVGAVGTDASYSLLAGVGRNSQTAGQTVDVNAASAGGSFADTKYGRATLKIGGNGLLSGSGGKFGNQYIGLDNSITFGVDLFHSSNGANSNAEDYTNGLTKNAYEGDIRINYGNARLVAQYARFNEVIADATTDISSGKRDAISLEGDYWFYPWLFGAVRYETLKDDLNGEYRKLIPGIGALLRPNCKIGVEYVSVSKDTFSDLAVSSYRPTNSWSFYAQLGF